MIELYGKDEEMAYLEHHGVLGMRWGVHRFQTVNGDITAKGEKKFNKVASSKLSQSIHKRRAISVYKKNAKINKKMEKSENKRADHYLEKASKSRNNSDHFLEKASEWADRAAKSNMLKESSKLAIKQIKSGELKAGRDFIVQTDLNLHLANYAIGAHAAKTTLTKNINEAGTMDPSMFFGFEKDRTVIRRK